MKYSKYHKNNIYKIHNLDARKINSVLTEKIVDVTITSPPYFDMKDYGSENQIGYGQQFDEYLEDIKKVFKNVYNITKETGSLWIVIDTFKKEDKIIPLPFRVADKLDEIGWKLQDIIIWNKDKTVPWVRKGQTKNKFEYILFFVKNPKKFKYYNDRIRQYDTKHLKKWWIRYPERYNPKGKSAEEVWNYPIPTQGSWGKGYVKHFCPLPTDMIGSMIKLTSDETDVILDPFAGTGSVLVQAVYMKRKYIGFELSEEYITRFNKYLKETIREGSNNYNILNDTESQQENFEETILKLRALKFAKVLRNNLDKDVIKFIRAIHVEILDEETTQPHKIIRVAYTFLVSNHINEEKYKDKIEILKLQIFNHISENPLSKFGIEPIVILEKDRDIFVNRISSKKHFNYTNRITHKYSSIFDGNLKDFSIISSINLDINEKDFE